MIRLPNFFLVVFVKPAAMRFPLFFALPLFLVDELLEIAEIAYWLLGRKRVPRKWRASASGVVASLRQVWRKTRRAGSFTLVDIEARNVRIWVRLL